MNSLYKDSCKMCNKVSVTLDTIHKVDISLRDDAYYKQLQELQLVFKYSKRTRNLLRTSDKESK